MGDRGDPEAGSDALMQEALSWIVRLTSGEATAADADSLARWRAQSSEHERSFVQALCLREALRAAGKEIAELPDSAVQAARYPQQRRRVFNRRVLLGGAVAASAAGVLIARPPLGLWPSFSELSADYRTGTGERREVLLPDGARLDLNTQTSIVVRSSQGQRQVELIAGEAAISAAASPFVLLAAEARTTAEQARFNVRLLGDRVQVTCLSGSVAVMWRSRAITLEPGQQVAYSPEVLEEPAEIDPAVVVAWQQGLLIFKDEPLAAVIEEVNRYRLGKIILTKRELESLRVNGVFHLDRLDGVIAQVRSLGAEVTTLPGGFVLLS
ncbi:FecR domain-containing protein [Algihabitans albus]|uniref:FecR family protein n=1 Tax=Algihabitans albus TaxID=2164067 RepID=UPI0035CF7374